MSATTQEYTFTLGAGDQQQLAVRGRFWRIDSISVAGLAVRLSFDSVNSITVKEGTKGEFSGLGPARAIIAADQACTVVLQMGDERVESEAATVSLSGVTAEIAVPNSGGATSDATIPPLGTATVGSGTNVARAVYADIDNATFLRLSLGSDLANATRGFQLMPGSMFSFDGTVNVRLFNPSTTASLKFGAFGLNSI